MNKRIILAIIFALVAITAFSLPRIGLEYNIELGLIANDIFAVYQEPAVEATLGNSTYTSAMLRLYVSTFFIQAQTEWRWYLAYTNMQKAMFEVSIGRVPYDFLEVELGWRYKDSYILSAPSEFHLAEHNIFLSVSGKVGNTP